MKIYLDVTETIHRGLKTGIQRVVREITTNAPNITQEFNVKIVPVMAENGNFYPLVDLASLHPAIKVKTVESPHWQLIKKVVKKIFFLKLLALKWIDYRTNHRIRRLHMRKPILPDNKDMLLLLDAFWGDQNQIGAANKFRQEGGIVIPIIHDLIALTHPKYFDDEHARNFATSLDKLLKISSCIMTISQTEMTEIRQVLSRTKSWQALRLKIDYFYHGSDFSLRDTEEHADWPQGLWVEGVPVYLMVGTIEPRKQHAFVLDVFESRWSRGMNEKLLFIGKSGWKTENLIERIVKSPYFGKLLFMVNDASDHDLNDAYKRAYASIMASEIEGFGLPLIESLQSRLPVLANDIPVFREIGGRYCQYFVTGDAASLDSAIEELQTNIGSVRNSIKDFRWQTWEESAEQLVSRAIRMADEDQ